MSFLVIVSMMTVQCNPGGAFHSTIVKHPAVAKYRDEQLQKNHEQVIEAYSELQKSNREFYLKQEHRIASIRQNIEQLEQKGDPADAEFIKGLREMVTIMSNFNRRIAPAGPRRPDQ